MGNSFEIFSAFVKCSVNIVNIVHQCRLVFFWGYEKDAETVTSSPECCPSGCKRHSRAEKVGIVKKLQLPQVLRGL